MTTHTNIMLHDLPDSEFRLGGDFDESARKSGYASGKSAANDLNLWGLTLGETLEIINKKEKNTMTAQDNHSEKQARAQLEFARRMTDAERAEGRAINAANDARDREIAIRTAASLAEKNKRPACARCSCGGYTNVRRENGVTICDDCAN